MTEASGSGDRKLIQSSQSKLKGSEEYRMHDTVTADGKGFDQDSGRAGNANLPTGRTTAATEPHLGTNNAAHTLLQGLSEEEVRLRRARGKGNNVKLQTSRSYG